MSAEQEVNDSGIESTSGSPTVPKKEEVEEPEVKRRKLIFYEEFTDGTLRFDQGETLKVNMSTLAVQSPLFHRMIKESTDRVIEIKNCDFKLFQEFLNCMLDFEMCTVDKAITIFPIAMKYEATDFLKKLTNILTPAVMNSAVCHTLNMVVSNKYKELEDVMISFLRKNRFQYYIFSDERFYGLLEPESVFRLLRIIVDLDSYMIETIFKWGKTYLKTKKKRFVNLKAFFDNFNISRYITVFSFETIQKLIDLEESNLGAGYFTQMEINSYIKANGENCDTRRASWFDVKTGEILVEKLVIKNVPFFANQILNVKINHQRAVFYECPQRSDGKIISFVYTYEILKTKSVQNSSTFASDKFLNEKYPANNCGLKIDIGKNIISDLKIEIKRTFYGNCRILKTSAKTFDVVERNPEDLYFTDSVEFKHIEKVSKK